VSGRLVQTSDSGVGRDGVGAGDGDGEIYTEMETGKGFFVGTGWGRGKFDWDGVAMGTLLFTL